MNPSRFSKFLWFAFGGKKDGGKVDRKRQPRKRTGPVLLPVSQGGFEDSNRKEMKRAWQPGDLEYLASADKKEKGGKQRRDQKNRGEG